MFETILLASDGSEHALKAAEAAGAIAKEFDARLIMLHVFEIPVVPTIADGGTMWFPLELDAPSDEAQEAVAGHTRSVLPKDLKIEDRQEMGPPASEIVRVAEEEKADVIVLGSRGLGAAGRFFLGSVSDRVMHQAHCSVLVVR